MYSSEKRLLINVPILILYYSIIYLAFFTFGSLTLSTLTQSQMGELYFRIGFIIIPTGIICGIIVAYNSNDLAKYHALFSLGVNVIIFILFLFLTPPWEPEDHSTLRVLSGIYFGALIIFGGTFILTGPFFVSLKIGASIGRTFQSDYYRVEKREKDEKLKLKLREEHQIQKKTL